MSTIKEEVAKNLLFYRKKAGLTQKQLADMLGVKNTSISNWELGNNSMDIDTLFQICTILNVSITDMYGRFSNTFENDLTPHEKTVINAYRSHPDAQSYVDKILDVKPDSETIADDIIETVKQFTGKNTVSK